MHLLQGYLESERFMDNMDFENECISYCSHGGCCMLDAGHEGLHDSTYCTWSDAEAVTEEEADAILLERNPEAAKSFLIARDLQRRLNFLLP